jgi:YfiH family protein
MLEIIKPNWPAPKNIVAFTTTRSGGVSQDACASLNLGNRNADSAENIAANRKILRTEMQLPNEPYWINQTHSTIAIEIAHEYKITEADASFTIEKNCICVVNTADCLPLLVCDRDGAAVAAIHAGWRGLLDGVIENTLELFPQAVDKILVWLGPAIGSEVYEVGDEVRAQFIEHDPQAELAFKPSPNDRFLMNIYLLARQRLAKKNITAIYGGDFCTYTQSDQFFSHRRDSKTGRQASLIYFS